MDELEKNAGELQARVDELSRLKIDEKSEEQFHVAVQMAEIVMKEADDLQKVVDRAETSTGSRSTAHQAFIADIEVKPEPLDKRCPRCVEFLNKIDQYVLHNQSLISDVEKLKEANSLLKHTEKTLRTKISSYQKDVSALKGRILEKDLAIKLQNEDYDKKKNAKNCLLKVMI